MPNCSHSRSAASSSADELKPEQVSMGKLANVNAAIDVAELLAASSVEMASPALSRVMRHMANLEVDPHL